MSKTLTTSDIWLGGFLLSETDAELDEVQIDRNGRQTVLFSFRGENLAQLARSYCRDEAVANVTRLRAEMNFLRDIIFESKRN